MAVLQILLGLCYPPLIYFGLTVMSPRQVALCVGATLVVRLLVTSPSSLAAYTRMFWLPVVAMASISAATAASNHPLGLLLTPVVINFGMLCVFGGSFLQQETTVERLAKIQVPDLSKIELNYCRHVTAIWCSFFFFNGTISLTLALRGDLAIWTVYTGLIGYIIMGTLGASEYLFRHWRFRRFVGGALDAPMKWLFKEREKQTHDPKTSPVRLDPDELGESRGAGFIHQDLCVPEDLSVWPGHFPEYSIVPGVLQLRWVLARIHRLTEGEGDIEGFDSLKFKRPLLPGQKFKLEVQISERDPSRFQFRLIDGESVFSSGVLCLKGTHSS
jgi:uncharacterized membrane protein/3-hydroxymyristoyl/3-hydroxydecanoyl-(acyl carrier protein) dehydratase